MLEEKEKIAVREILIYLRSVIHRWINTNSRSLLRDAILFICSMLFFLYYS